MVSLLGVAKKEGRDKSSLTRNVLAFKPTADEIKKSWPCSGGGAIAARFLKTPCKERSFE